MIIREKYMMLSLQSFPYTTAKYLNKVFTEDRRNSTKPVDLKQSDFFDQRSEGESAHLFALNGFWIYVLAYKYV